MRIETLILKHLIISEEYMRKVLPFLKPEYFTDNIDRTLYKEINTFASNYNVTPSIEAVLLSIHDLRNITEDTLERCEVVLKEIDATKQECSDINWLIDKTEKFCQEKAVYNAVMDSIAILDGKDKNLDKGSIPGLLSEALGISFDTSVGHDYLDNADDRYEFMHKTEERIPCDIDYLNKITNGGPARKTLNMILAGPHAGKSLAMCHLSACSLIQGQNVLYITCEMAEEKIAERIDANLLNVPIKDLAELTKDSYEKKIAKVRSKTSGKLIVKEYPTAAASVNHFRTLLNELKLKKNFKPDIIFVDYLNICCSSRVKFGGGVNSYTYVKSIAEELRGLAIEYDVPIWSATQTTRGGFDNSDISMTDVSESFGVNATCDFMVALIVTEDLKELDQIMVKQLKNRYTDMNIDTRAVIGVDRSKMKLYNVEQSGQVGIVGANTTSSTPIGFIKAQPKKSFEGFTV